MFKIKRLGDFLLKFIKTKQNNSGYKGLYICSEKEANKTYYNIGKNNHKLIKTNYHKPIAKAKNLQYNEQVKKTRKFSLGLC